jgi:ferric-dicitrate binding protein FerR (iron transport regulator)
LADITEDFNRYNHNSHIRVEGDGVAALRFSGSIDADDPASLVEYLRKTTALEVMQVEDGWLIRRQ